MAKGTSLTDSEGHVLSDTKDGFTILAEGVTVPSDGAAGYNPGCIFIHRAGPGNAVAFTNVGSTTSAEFNPMAAEVVSTRFVFDSNSSLRIDTPITMFGIGGENTLFFAPLDATPPTGAAAGKVAIGVEDGSIRYIQTYWFD